MTVHVLLYALVSLLSAWVYHGLRCDSVQSALRMGTRRFLSLFVAALVFGVALQLFTSRL